MEYEKLPISGLCEVECFTPNLRSIQREMFAWACATFVCFLLTVSVISLKLIYIDVLNRCSDISSEKETVHVMKYIFPRQFRLHNVFTSKMDFRQTAQPFRDYTLRENEIRSTPVGDESENVEEPKGVKLAVPRLPKRLRGAPLQLISALRKRHQRCSYVELLRYYCPVVVGSSLDQTHTYSDEC
jgi:hypothetical protein